MIALDFAAGTRTTTTLPLSDEESGVSLTDGGEVVELELRWPDDPSVMRAKYEWLAMLAQIERELKDEAGNVREGVPSARQAELLAMRDDALAGYCAAVVASWSVKGVKCTSDNTRKLFARAPFVLGLILDRLGEHERFLPESLRTSANESAPLSEAAA